jgi:hypothetical protein
MTARIRWLLGRDYSSLLVAIALFFSTVVTSEASKRLVLIAGARQEAIQEFYNHYATGSETSPDGTESIRGWRWPVLREEDLDLVLSESEAGTAVSRYNIFDLLFRQKDDSVIQKVLTDAIRESWENSSNGVILGEERFGNVGENPFTSDDALKVIYRLMENLSIRSKDVTLVLVYDTPRIEQWATVVREKSMYETYNDFLCQGSEADKRFEYIDTTMNPFKLATVYRQQGWNVVVLDENGVRRSGSDPSHAIACNILGASCQEGLISGLQEEISNPAPSYLNDEMDKKDKRELELEELFLLRDCMYKKDLEHDSGGEEFQILNQESIWKNCRNRYDSAFREQITDVNFFLNVIQSQTGCESEAVDLSDILAYANSTSFVLWPILLVSILCLVVVTGLFCVRKLRGRNIKDEFDGVFRDSIFGKKKSLNPEPSVTPTPKPSKASLCNACKFVRFDPDCIFCNGQSLSSFDIGREVERRIKQQSVNTANVIGEARDDYSYSPHGVDTSHFDMNLRKIRSQNMKHPRKIEEAKQEKGSKVLRNLKDLLDLKNESGDEVDRVTETTDVFAGNNLQTIALEEKDDRFV